MTTAEFSKRAIISIALVLVPLLVWRLSNVVLITIGAVLVATLLTLGAAPFRRIRLPRSLALMISGLIAIAILGGAGYLFGTGVGSELEEILRRANEAQQTITTALRQSSLGSLLLTHLGENVPVGDLVSGIFHISTNFLIALVVTAFAGIYLAAQQTSTATGWASCFLRNGE